MLQRVMPTSNEKRDWWIYKDFAHTLIHHARELYSKDAFGVSLKETVYALDSTMIDLAIALHIGKVQNTQRCSENAHVARPTS